MTTKSYNCSITFFDNKRIYQLTGIKITEKTKHKMNKLIENFFAFITNTKKVNNYRTLILIQGFEDFFIVIITYLSNLFIVDERS